MKNPLVSVILPIYNEPIKWISQSINSILNQTYSNLELIIINDNPARNCNKEMLNNLSKKDKRIIVMGTSIN